MCVWEGKKMVLWRTPTDKRKGESSRLGIGGTGKGEGGVAPARGGKKRSAGQDNRLCDGKRREILFGIGGKRNADAILRCSARGETRCLKVR